MPSCHLAKNNSRHQGGRLKQYQRLLLPSKVWYICNLATARSYGSHVHLKQGQAVSAVPQFWSSCDSSVQPAKTFWCQWYLHGAGALPRTGPWPASTANSWIMLNLAWDKKHHIDETIDVLRVSSNCAKVYNFPIKGILLPNCSHWLSASCLEPIAPTSWSCEPCPADPASGGMWGCRSPQAWPAVHPLFCNNLLENFIVLQHDLHTPQILTSQNCKHDTA